VHFHGYAARRRRSLAFKGPSARELWSGAGGWRPPPCASCSATSLGSLDALLLDLPPGMQRYVELCDILGAALRVDRDDPTPESHDAVRRAMRAAVERGSKLLGIVENMVGHIQGNRGDDWRASSRRRSWRGSPGRTPNPGESCGEAGIVPRVDCDKQMARERGSGRWHAGGDVQVSTCGRVVAMLTNPMETQLVSSLGVEIGGRTVPEQPSRRFARWFRRAGTTRLTEWRTRGHAAGSNGAP